MPLFSSTASLPSPSLAHRLEPEFQKKYKTIARGSRQFTNSKMTSIPLDVLEGSLFEAPVPQETRRTILSRMFDVKISRADYQIKIQGWDVYFDHWYEDQCKSGERAVSISTHREVLDIIGWLKDGEDKETIREKVHLLQNEENEEDATLIEGSIDLAARLWLHLAIGDMKQSLTVGRLISWQNGPIVRRLYGSIGAPFREMPTSRPTILDPMKVPKSFNALNIEQIGGIQICWTSNLEDHLRMKDDDTKLSIFHHVSFLELHLGSNR